MLKRNKRKKTGHGLYDIVVGIKMINSGRYAEAIEQLKKYRNIDAMICAAFAYCYLIRAKPIGRAVGQENPHKGFPRKKTLHPAR